MNWRSIDMPALTTAVVGAGVAMTAFYRVDDPINAVTVAAILLLPCITTLIAKRHPFLWGYAPYAISVVIYAAMDWRYIGLGIVFGIAAGCWLIPVWLISSGVGLGLRRLRERQAKLAARAGSKPLNVQDPSVWPPAPKL